MQPAKDIKKTKEHYYLDKNFFSSQNSSYNGENMPNGIDYQSISWKTDMPHTPRKVFRQMRCIAYKPFRHFKDSPITKHPIKNITKGEPYYCFEKFYKVGSFWSGNFQIKNSMIAAKKSELLYPYQNGFVHHSLNELKETKVHLEDNLHPITVDYHRDIIAMGTIHGKILLYDLNKQETIYNKVLISNSAHNNSVAFFKEKESKSIKFVCGGDDHHVRFYDMNEGQTKLFLAREMEKPINFIKISPDKNLMIILGDKTDVDIFDIRTGKVVTKFAGHEDYGFTADWHPGGVYLATGNQDCTTRIWDMRKPKKTVNILQTQLGNVGKVKYSGSGDYLVVGENIDFTNIYNVNNNYNDMQVVDYFGEILGLDFDSEDGETLFVGIMLQKYNGLFEFNLRKAEYFNSLSNYLF